MKKLKKLSLNKEEIVNLNNFEMRDLKGGSSIPCTVGYALATYELIKDGYNAGQQASWWQCTPPESPTTDSIQKIWIGDEHVCMLPDVYVYGLNTNP